jgi:hypothetical protein
VTLVATHMPVLCTSYSPGRLNTMTIQWNRSSGLSRCISHTPTINPGSVLGVSNNPGIPWRPCARNGASEVNTSLVTRLSEYGHEGIGGGSKEAIHTTLNNRCSVCVLHHPRIVVIGGFYRRASRSRRLLQLPAASMACFSLCPPVV